MQGRKEEAEVIVRLDHLEQKANICVVSWPSMARKMAKLYGKQLPKSGLQAYYWTIPLKAVSFRSLAAVGKRGRVPVNAFKPRADAQSGD